MGSAHQYANENGDEQKQAHQPVNGEASEAGPKATRPDDQQYNKTAEQAPEQEPKREPKNVTISDIELEKLKSELKEYKDKYLHALAESENARKRLQKEKQELIQYALQNVIVDFLNPIDHMENALKYTQQMSDEVKRWALGFQMILTQFKDVLSDNGVSSFISEGTPFDHNLHEAIETVATADVTPGTVVQENLRGYKMGDRVIRPARVKVAKALPAPAKENEK
jgi:molecular chaperone GrpE